MAASTTQMALARAASPEYMGGTILNDKHWSEKIKVDPLQGIHVPFKKITANQIHI
jgi:hypothetical protein